MAFNKKDMYIGIESRLKIQRWYQICSLYQSLPPFFRMWPSELNLSKCVLTLAARRVSHKKQDLLLLPEHLIAPFVWVLSMLWGLSLSIKCFVHYCMSVCLFSFLSRAVSISFRLMRLNVPLVYYFWIS